MRRLWGCLCVAGAWGAPSGHPSAFVSTVPVSRTGLCDVSLSANSCDFNDVLLRATRLLQLTGSLRKTTIAASPVFTRSGEGARRRKHALLQMSSGRAHEKNGKRSGPRPSDDDDAIRPSTSQSDQEAGLGIAFVGRTALLAAPSVGAGKNGELTRIASPSTSGGGRIGDSRANVEKIPRRQDVTDANIASLVRGDNTLAPNTEHRQPVSSEESSSTARVDRWRWPKLPWKEDEPSVVASDKGDTARIDDGEITFIEERRALSPDAAEGSSLEESKMQVVSQESKGLGSVLSLLRLDWPWSRDNPPVDASRTSSADDSDGRGERGSETATPEEHEQEDNLILSSILSIMSISWPWSGDDSNDLAPSAQPPAISDGGNRTRAEGDQGQGAYADVVYDVLRSVAKLSGPWSQGDAEEEHILDTEREGSQADEKLSSSSPPQLDRSEGSILTRWLSRWGEGDDTVDAERRALEKEPSRSEGLASALMESQVEAGLQLATTSRTPSVNRLRDRPLSALKSALERPASMLRRNPREATLSADASLAASPAAVVPSADTALPPSQVLSLPPAAKLLRQINASNPSFPTRVPWRPPGYRWGATLLSRRSSATPLPSLDGQSAAIGDRDGKKGQTLVELQRSEDAPYDQQASQMEGEQQFRRRGWRTKLSAAKSGFLTTLRLVRRRAQSKPTSETASEEPSHAAHEPQLEKQGTAEAAVTSDPGKGDPDLGTDDLPWWQAGAAIAFGVGVTLYRPLSGRLPWLAADTPGEGEYEPENTQSLQDGNYEDQLAPVVPPKVSPRSETHLAAVQETAVSEIELAEPEVSSRDPHRGQVVGRVSSALANKVVTTSRRARLWALLRRKSMARAKPLVQDMESGIKTLSVSVRPSEESVGDNTGEARGAASSPTMVDDVEALAKAATGEDSKSDTPQAVGGGGWNLFGFFPKDKEEVSLPAPPTDVDNSFSQGDADTKESYTQDSSASETGEEQEGLQWPRSAWVEGLDPRAQIEAAMAQYLRSALGYGGYGMAAPTIGVPPETLAAATAAATAAAVEEGEKQLEAKSISPTARYLDELSPATEDASEDGWSGAEAAAAAAGKAAGAVMDAAGVAAATAADVAAAATAATFKVAAPFGQAESSEDGWQVAGSWKKGKFKDDEEFGEGKLGVRPRKVDERKAQDMVIDYASSNSLKRSVPSDERLQKQRAPGSNILSAAVQRSRLPRKWKSKAAAAASAAASATPLKDMDMQDITLRRLGRVGVAEIASSMLLIASETALQVGSVEELEQFRAEGGMPRLLMALSPTPYTTKADGLAAIRNLLRVSPESVAAEILDTAGAEALYELRRLVGAPGEPWSAAAARAAAAATDSFDAMRLQAEAVQFLQELALASEEALARVRTLPNLIPALTAIAYPGTGPLGVLRDKIGRSLGGVSGMVGGAGRAEAKRGAEDAVPSAAVSAASKLLAMLGVHNWRPRTPGQKGLRILSLDGGGTRGVLTIALLREVLKGFDKDVHEVFDVICGTSTGGILAMLFASEKQSLESASTMYDSLIVKIFRKDLLANAKLVLWQAQYSSADWEAILEEILGDRRMIDTMTSPDNPKVVICSTIMNVSPLEMMLWRNYGYRPDQEAVYKGDFRRKMRECVRATTAAPSFFTPLVDGDMMYADGAFMANNPTSIAITEAKLLFPDVPIECVLSVGTGYYPPTPSNAGMSWNTVINQLVNSATDTEGVDAMLKTFLPRNQYFRFNPSIKLFDIDETRVERLDELKQLAKEYVARPEVKARAEELRRVLRGEGNSGWPSVGGASAPRQGSAEGSSTVPSVPTASSRSPGAERGVPSPR